MGRIGRLQHFWPHLECNLIPQWKENACKSCASESVECVARQYRGCARVASFKRSFENFLSSLKAFKLCPVYPCRKNGTFLDFGDGVRTSGLLSSQVMHRNHPSGFRDKVRLTRSTDGIGERDPSICALFLSEQNRLRLVTAHDC